MLTIPPQQPVVALRRFLPTAGGPLLGSGLPFGLVRFLQHVLSQATRPSTMDQFSYRERRSLVAEREGTPALARQ